MREWQLGNEEVELEMRLPEGCDVSLISEILDRKE
jgi:hypothetical protein